MQLSRAQPDLEADSKTTGCPYHIERPQINLDFIDVYYPTRTGSSVGGRKQILRGVSGSFKCGELTAILGSSGAGKSTLLNVLTGYVSVNVVGSIRLNGHPCHMNIFRKLSSYIMQDDLVQPYLSVEEAMKVVADLKLGKEYSENDKIEVINKILETLGLEKHRYTRTEKLSGGQKKRVSIALELVNDPPVIFLDEPTTGLDVVTSTQVIQLLQKLARQGRTVVCTIHQPTAYICQYFDHFYVMARGHCVYQGSFKKLVPFLSHMGYDCPTTYNPADYIIEVIQGTTKEVVNTVSQAVQNGKLSIEAGENANEEGGFVKVFRKQDQSILNYSGSIHHRVGFTQQFVVLIKRRFKQQFRNLVRIFELTLFILLLHHILNGFLLGTIFRGVGNDANRHFENFKFLISVVVFFMYTYVMGPVLLFPMEMKHIKREYFNRWYSMKAYFAALSLASLPCQLLFGFLFIIICYAISDQPIDLYRFGFFTLTGLLLGYTSEGWGLTVGSLFSNTNGSIVGPASIVPLLALSVYGMGYGTSVQSFMKFLMSLSYLRYGVVGLSTSVYGQNRTLYCDNDKYVYCHYTDSMLLLKDFGMEGKSVHAQIIGLICFLILYRVTAYFGIRYTLNFDFSRKILIFVTKVFRLRGNIIGDV